MIRLYLGDHGLLTCLVLLICVPDLGFHLHYFNNVCCHYIFVCQFILCMTVVLLLYNAFDVIFLVFVPVSACLVTLFCNIYCPHCHLGPFDIQCSIALF